MLILLKSMIPVTKLYCSETHCCTGWYCPLSIWTCSAGFASQSNVHCPDATKTHKMCWLTSRDSVVFFLSTLCTQTGRVLFVRHISNARAIQAVLRNTLHEGTLPSSWHVVHIETEQNEVPPNNTWGETIHRSTSSSSLSSCWVAGRARRQYWLQEINPDTLILST